MATAGPTAQAIILSILAGLGLIGDTNTAPVNYQPLTLTAAYCLTNTVPVPAGAANQQIQLTSLFPGIALPRILAVQEVSQLSGNPVTAWTGVLKWSFDNAGTKAQFLPGDMWLVMLDPSAVVEPSLYLDNTDVANGAILNITLIGS